MWRVKDAKSTWKLLGVKDDSDYLDRFRNLRNVAYFTMFTF
ncbi:MAG TPA: hypothetical protein VD815_10000 [Candidatus Saccharimonadales bacterium]|nr:hypothetical protein [Candidatus Saccharimonadales bacterium]